MICADVMRDLDPYIDRELPPDSAAAVQAHLSACASCQQRLAEREDLGRLVRLLPYRQAPDRLRARVAERARYTRPSRYVMSLAAAAVLVLSVAGGISLVRSTGTSNGIVSDAVDSHVRSLMAEHLFDVHSTDQHTVKPWFLGKLDFSPPVVDLASTGFPLVGGRLDYLSGRPVAALVYQRQKHTINLFVWPSDGPLQLEEQSVRGFHVRRWVRAGMSFCAVSDLNDAELTQFARALQAS